MQHLVLGIALLAQLQAPPATPPTTAPATTTTPATTPATTTTPPATTTTTPPATTEAPPEPKKSLLPAKTKPRMLVMDLTDKGAELERQLSEAQQARVARAYRQAGADAVAGYRKVLQGLIDPSDHDRVLQAILRR